MVLTSPNALANAARCYDSCIPTGMRGAVILYLQAVISGQQALSPSELSNRARCFSSCIPPGAMTSALISILAEDAGITLTPSQLANAARCYESCIPRGMISAVLIYVMADRANLLGLTPSQLANAARCYQSCIASGMRDAIWVYLLRPNLIPAQVLELASPYLYASASTAIVTYLEVVIDNGTTEEVWFFGQPDAPIFIFGDPNQGFGFGGV